MASNPSLQGTIAIKGVDGKYLKVTSTNALEFGTQEFDDNAKFIVQKEGDKIGLKGAICPSCTGSRYRMMTDHMTGNNSKFVNMYYVDDVKCEGPTGGVHFGIVYLADGQVNLTVTGYSGQNGRTKYLSSQAGSKAYKGSLHVHEFEDFTCRFTIENH